MSVEVSTPRGATRARPSRAASVPYEKAGFAPALAITVAVAVASFALVMSALLLVRHPAGAGIAFAPSLPQQNQGAKTILYVLAFAVILPLALIAGPRFADAVAAGPNRRALGPLAAVLAATLAAAIIVARLVGLWLGADGLGMLLAVVGIWSALAAGALARAAQARPWQPLLRLAGHALGASTVAGALLLGTVLCVTSLKDVSALALVLGAAVVVGVVSVYGRVRLPRLMRWQGIGIDIAICALLLLAIPNVVVFEPSPVPPNVYFEPGIIQFHQDFLLGPANQLLGGGALLVNVPVSQYGVGFIYLLAAWFHLVPIGYGTYGFLDGIVTALFYAAGYAVLRIAGVGRWLAGSAIALALAAFVYNLYYSIGALPQQGPLRFGLPMAVVLAAVVAGGARRRAGLARAAALVVLGVASVWSVEMLAYTLVTFGAVLAVEAWFKPAGRLRWLVGQLGLAVAACFAAHLILAAWTLLATGHLPDWGQYLAYVHALVLGGQKAGQISYGFANWSPGLAVGAGCLASAAAIVLLVARAPAIARRERIKVIALSGTTAYAIALFSYTDNRSSTYLLPYVALPLLLAATLWLGMLLRCTREVSRQVRLGGVAFASSVAVVMLAAAWSSIGTRFSDSALAHAYPGGGLRAAIHRLWHPPPIDPRAPTGERLLDRYMPGKRALILLPAWPDLGTEILIRSHRSNALFIADPKADAFIAPSVWTGRLTRQIAALAPGDRLLTDATGLRIAAQLRGRPSSAPLSYPIGNFNPQLEWILQRIAERFRLQPIVWDRSGLVVAQLASG